MVPIRHAYCYQNDDLAEFFGVKPVNYYDWRERDGADTEREGYAAAVGIFVDGPEIGTAKPVWLERHDAEDAEDDDASADEQLEASAKRRLMRQNLYEIVILDIIAYLTDIDSNTAIPAATLADRKLRATAWFGIIGYADSEEDNSCPDDPDWNPSAWAWEQTIEYVAGHVADIVVEDIVRLYNGDRDHTADNAIATALVGMFDIPIDIITARATAKLQDPVGDDTQNDTDAGVLEEDSEPDAAAIAVDVETLTDENDVIPFGRRAFLPAPAEA